MEYTYNDLALSVLSLYRRAPMHLVYHPDLQWLLRAWLTEYPACALEVKKFQVKRPTARKGLIYPAFLFCQTKLSSALIRNWGYLISMWSCFPQSKHYLVYTGLSWLTSIDWHRAEKTRTYISGPHEKSHLSLRDI